MGKQLCRSSGAQNQQKLNDFKFFRNSWASSRENEVLPFVKIVDNDIYCVITDKFKRLHLKC